MARCRRRCRVTRGSRSWSAPIMPSARWTRASPRSEVLNYPDYEVIVVNDGSSDRTLEIAESYPYCRIISQPNKGLSVARNVGAEAATGEIVAYTDSDCVADPDWLTYLVATMEAGGLAACGGPNFPPPENSLVPAAVAVAPGGPTHVLLSDEVAEHIAGCNMAFRRDDAARHRRLRPGLSRRRRRRRHLLAAFRMPATRSASARRRSSGISAATRSKPIATSSAATARPRRWSIRSIRSASTCSARRNGSAASMAICRPRCCCRAGR